MFNLKEILDLTYGCKSEEKKKQLSIYIINNSKLLHKRFNNKKLKKVLKVYFKGLKKS